jgi:hypothetical protein
MRPSAVQSSRPLKEDLASPVNRWNIPDWLEREVLARDRHCIYCGVDFAMPSTSRRGRPSWEHIINDARIVTPENIALCCVGCNASKGARNLAAWLESKYCKACGMSRDSVASIVRVALERNSGAGGPGWQFDVVYEQHQF